MGILSTQEPVTGVFETEKPVLSAERAEIRAAQIEVASSALNMPVLPGTRTRLEERGDKPDRMVLRQAEKAQTAEFVQEDLIPVMVEEGLGAEDVQPELEELVDAIPLASGEVYRPENDVIERNVANFIVDDTIASDPVVQSRVFDPEQPEDEQLDLSVVRDSSALAQRFSNLRNLLSEKGEERSTGTKIADFLALMIPLGETIRADQLLSRDTLFLGQAKQEEMRKFWAGTQQEKMARLDKFEREIEESGLFGGQNITAAMIALEELITFDNVDVLLSSGIEILDVIGIGAVVKGFVRGGKAFSLLNKAKPNPVSDGGGAATVAKRAGNRKLSEQITIAAKEAEDAGEAISPALAEDAVKHSLDAAFIPTFEGVGIGQKVRRKLEQARRTLLKSTDNFTTDRLTKPEQLLAAERQIGKLKKEINLNTEIDKRHIDLDISDKAGVNKVIVTLGHGADGLEGYASARGAKNGAKRMGLLEGSFNIHEEAGQFFVQIDRTVGERAIVNAVDERLLSESVLGRVPLLRRGVGTKSQLGLDANEGIELSTRNFQKMQAAVGKAQVPINKLSTAQTKDFDTILQLGHQQEVWFSPAELKSIYSNTLGIEITEKELAAHVAYRQVSDFDYMLRNDDVRVNLARLGFQEVNFPDGVITNGKSVDTNAFLTTGQAENVAMVDKITGEIFEVGELTTEFLRTRLLDLGENGILVKVLGTTEDVAGVKTKSATDVTYVLTEKSEVGFSALRQQQLNYVAGGRTVYRGRQFIKQSRVVNERFVGAKTHFNLQDAKEADDFVIDYNLALGAYEEAVSSGTTVAKARATKVISENTYFSSFEEFNEAVEAGTILRAPFELTGNRQLPTFGRTNNAARILSEDPDFVQLPDHFTEQISNGRLFYSTRGEPLRHPKEGLAEVVDPFKALSSSIQQSTRTASFRDFSVRQTERFLTRYGSELENIEGKAPLAAMAEGRLRSGSRLTATQIDEMETFREAILRGMNTPTPLERTSLAVREEVADALSRAGFKDLARGVDEFDVNPITAVRSLGFKARLGLGDVSQVVVQLSMTPAVLAISPIQGAKTIAAYPYIRFALQRQDPEVWLQLGKFASTHTLGAVKPVEFVAFMEDLVKSGTHLVGGTQAQLDDLSKISISKSPFTRGFRQFGRATDAASFFFNEGERANRVLAFGIAWFEQGLKGGARLSAEQGRAVAVRSETLGGNMTTSSRAFWQRGVASIPTQFAAHPLRVMEIIADGLTNTGKTADKLTPAEAARFTLTLGAVYGAGGVAFGQFAFSMFEDANGQPPTRSEFRRLLKEGIFQQLIPETDLSRIKPFGQDNIIEQIFDPEGNLWELALGPSGDLFGNVAQAVSGAGTMMTLMFGDEEDLRDIGAIDVPMKVLARTMIEDLALSISSVNRLTQGYWAWKYNEFINRNREVMSDDSINELNVLAITLGFPPITVGIGFEARFNLARREQIWDDTAKVVTRTFRDFARSDSPEERDALARTAAAQMLIFQDDRVDREQIWNRVQRNMRRDTAFDMATLQKMADLFGGDYALQQFKFREEDE